MLNFEDFMLFTFLNIRRDMLWLDLIPEFIEKNDYSDLFENLIIYGLVLPLSSNCSLARGRESTSFLGELISEKGLVCDLGVQNISGYYYMCWGDSGL